MNHIDPASLNEYLDAALSEEQSRAIKAHLEICQTCAHALKELEFVFSALDEVADMPLATDLTPGVMAELGRQSTSMTTRLRLAVALQAATALSLLVLLWPRVQVWLDGMERQLVDAAAWIRRLQPLSLDQASTQVNVLFDWLREARPMLDVATDQWVVLLAIALIAWLVGNGFLMISNLNGGSDG